MTHSPSGAERSGSARKSFIDRSLSIIEEYKGGWLGATAAMAAIIAAA